MNGTFLGKQRAPHLDMCHNNNNNPFGGRKLHLCGRATYPHTTHIPNPDRSGQQKAKIRCGVNIVQLVNCSWSTGIIKESLLFTRNSRNEGKMKCTAPAKGNTPKTGIQLFHTENEEPTDSNSSIDGCDECHLNAQLPINQVSKQIYWINKFRSNKNDPFSY